MGLAARRCAGHGLVVLFPMHRAPMEERMNLKVVSSHAARGNCRKTWKQVPVSWESFTDIRHPSNHERPQTRRPNPPTLLSQTLRRQGLGRVLARDQSHIVRSHAVGGLPKPPVSSFLPRGAPRRNRPCLAFGGVRLGSVIGRRRGPQGDTLSLGLLIHILGGVSSVAPRLSISTWSSCENDRSREPGFICMCV